jgi:plasmid stability protein
MHNDGMASITIRNVPDDARDELASRAAASGRSLQEYLRSELIALAARPSVDVWLARVNDRKRATGTKLAAVEILGDLGEDRR